MKVAAKTEPQDISELSPDTEQLELFITMVGQRVRAARKIRRISRRILSERSGVSQRYLALLESGQGNISIALLYKLARALEQPIGWFFVDDKNPHSPSFQQQFESADMQTQSQIMALLGVDQKQRRICLIGLRGAGKSTLGTAVSEALGLPFIELNQEIEKLSGLSVAEVIDLYGQEGYRQLERQAVEELVSKTDSAVVAAAGGVVSAPDTYQHLLASFYTVWLKASPEEHMQRVARQGDDRPMAGNPQAMAELKSILTDRESHYAKADNVIDTTNKSIDESRLELIELARGWV